MAASSETQLLELQTQVWKARARAKQKSLERALAEPAKTSGDAALRTNWISRALKAVKHGQDEIKSRAAFMDVYAEHLSVLEMTLIAAAEQKNRRERKPSAK